MLKSAHARQLVQTGSLSCAFASGSANSMRDKVSCVLLQGIVFSVRPPKKSWKHIANLSGGEKTLSSLSLVFALHHYKVGLEGTAQTACTSSAACTVMVLFWMCAPLADFHPPCSSCPQPTPLYVMDEIDAALDFKNVSIGE